MGTSCIRASVLALFHLQAAARGHYKQLYPLIGTHRNIIGTTVRIVYSRPRVRMFRMPFSRLGARDELHLFDRLMRTLRPLYLGIAALMFLAVAVIVVRRGDDSIGSAPRAPARAELAVPVSPNRVGRASIATVPPRPSASSSVSASAPRSSSVEEETSVPVELPDSPSLEKQLSRNGAVPDYRVVYTYQLGLMAFYEKCMSGRIAQGVIYYYINWQVNEDHVASSPVFDRAGVPPEGHVSMEDELAFAECVKEYLAAHDQVYLPHAGSNEAAWGMRAVFPLRDSVLLKMIADAKAEPGSQTPSPDAATSDE